MIKLRIIKSDEYSNYVLEDNDNKKYEVNINFMGIDKPSIGTIIYIQEEVLKENVSLNYGLVDNTSSVNENELIVLVNNDKKTYLQRFYG